MSDNFTHQQESAGAQCVTEGALIACSAPNFIIFLCLEPDDFTLQEGFVH
jgi:hypothetical protein